MTDRPAVSREIPAADITRPPRVEQIAAWLQLWHRRHRTRQHLNRMDNLNLSDVGLSDADRITECRKWFWQT